MKIRATIAQWLSLLVLLPTLPLLLYAIFSTQRYTDERRTTIESQLVERTDVLAKEIREILAKNLGHIESLATSGEARKGDVAALYLSARHMLEANPDLAAVSLIDADDKMLFLTLRPFGETFPTSQVSAVRQVFASGKPVLSGAFRSPLNERVIVAALSVPVFHDGNVVYCLRAIIRSSTISALLRPDKLPNGWIATVVDADGVLIGRSHAPEQYVGRKASPQLLAAVRDQTRGLWEGVTLDGIETVTALRPVGNWGWHISLGVPKALLVAPLRRDMLSMVALGLVLLAAGIFTAIWLSRRILFSIRGTVEATKALLLGAPIKLDNTGIRELDQIRETLTAVDDYGRLLEERIAERTQALRQAKERSLHFAAQLDRSVEQERQRISREVHDQLGSVLTGIKMMFRTLPGGRLPDDQEKLLIRALDAGVDTARRIASELRPPLIDDLGLQAAVAQLLETRFRDSKILAATQLADVGFLLPGQALGAYRIIQEACTNVLRHSQASHFGIIGRLTPDDAYEITMTDDGVGMQPEVLRTGSLGITGMRERAEILNGSLTLENQSQGGVAITLRFPLSNPVDDTSDEDSAS